MMDIVGITRKARGLSPEAAELLPEVLKQLEELRAALQGWLLIWRIFRQKKAVKKSYSRLGEYTAHPAMEEIIAYLKAWDENLKGIPQQYRYSYWYPTLRRILKRTGYAAP